MNQSGIVGIPLTLDLWFQCGFYKSCTGTARLIRYADDFVVCFKQEADAIRFRQEMEERLNQFWSGNRPGKDQESAVQAKFQTYFGHYQAAEPANSLDIMY